MSNEAQASYPGLDDYDDDYIYDYDPEPDDDGCDHACGECGRGIPSYQTHGSLCAQCDDEIRAESSL